jgi:hypothetical protein
MLRTMQLPGSSRHQYPDHEGQAVANSNAEKAAEYRLLELLSKDHLQHSF